MSLRLTVRLGRGRTVETFAAVAERGGQRRDVVVKRPRPDTLNNREFVDAFVEWGEGLKAIAHDNLLEVLEVGQEDGAPYVMLEKVEGAPLSRILSELKKRKRSWKAGFALSIASRVAGALKTLHGAGRVHGGIDPSEVLISFAGEVKLSDAGLHLFDWVAGGDVTQPATYLSPEVARAERPLPQSDVYSLALVTLEMLIGQPLWTKEKFSIEGAILALKDFGHLGVEEIADPLTSFLRTCVAKEVAGRYPSGREAAADLSRLIADHRLGVEDRALGSFVRTLLPPLAKDDAPTMVAVKTQLERGPVAPVLPDPDETLEGGSVEIDHEEIERKVRGSSEVAGHTPQVISLSKTPGPAAAPHKREPQAARTRPALDRFGTWLVEHGGVRLLVALFVLALVLFVMVLQRIRG